jgi:hypothetical protein
MGSRTAHVRRPRRFIAELRPFELAGSRIFGKESYFGIVAIAAVKL